MKILDQTKWMRLKGCKKWGSIHSKQKGGFNPPFLASNDGTYSIGDPSDKEKMSTKVTFTCEGKATTVASFLNNETGSLL